MSNSWEYGILDDAVKKESSSISLNKVKDKKGGYPLFGASGLATHVPFYDQKEEYLTIIKDGAGVGRVTKHPPKSSALSTMEYIIPKDGYDIDFIKYFLWNIDFEKYESGSTIPHVYYRDYKKEPFPLISLSEQRKIVKTLDNVYENIESAKEKIEENVNNAEELLESKLKSIFSKVEETYEKKELGELAYVKSGGTPRTSNDAYWGTDNDIPWYSSGELNELYTKKSERFITSEGLENSTAKLFPKGSLLIGMYDTAALKMSILDREAAFNQAISAVKPNEDLNLIFVMYSINAMKSELLKLRRGVRQKNLNLTKIKGISIALPDIEIQNEIVATLNDFEEFVSDLKQNLLREKKSLSELEKSILEKAFSGKLTKDPILA